MTQVSPLFYLRSIAHYLRGRRVGLADITADYDTAAATYAQSWLVQMADVGAALLENAEIEPTASVLDVGCGTGATLAWLLQHGWHGRYVGIDASRGMLAQVPDGAGVSLLHGDAHELVPTLPAASFDLIVALWSWEYLRRAELLNAFGRLLNPGGKLVLLANRRDTLPEFEAAVVRLMSRCPSAVAKVFHWQREMPRDSRQFDCELRRADFAVVEVVADERRVAHDDGRAAVRWGFASGALAGVRAIWRGHDLEARLALELEAGLEAHRRPLYTTHRYVGGIGQRQ